MTRSTLKGRVFVDAAERSLVHGDGLRHLPLKERRRWFNLFSHYGEAFYMNGTAKQQREWYCLSLLFMAAMQ